MCIFTLSNIPRMKKYNQRPVKLADAPRNAMLFTGFNFCYMTQDSFLRELSKTLYDNGIELCPMLYRINKNRNNGEAN